MSKLGLLSQRRRIDLGVVISLIAGVMMATIGASPAYAVTDQTNEFSHKISVIDTTHPQTVTATAAMGTTPTGVAIAPAQLPPICDLKITKDMSPNPLMSGQSARVTLTVTNQGTGACPGRITLPSPLPLPIQGGTFLSDPKPSGLTFTSPPVATPAAGWSCSLPSGNASCANLTSLPSGYTVTFTINATVTITTQSGTTVTNCARISNSFDTNPANNESCVTKQVA
jgi:hypothetical protein